MGRETSSRSAAAAGAFGVAPEAGSQLGVGPDAAKGIGSSFSERGCPLKVAGALSVRAAGGFAWVALGRCSLAVVSGAGACAAGTPGSGVSLLRATMAGTCGATAETRG
ncbi:MAG: hypothetical protein B9S27_04770 [Opitutia bacterium Tous-C8FEB]|nr:MAG: hypothetical protein B9S27_04770 [Opitutae bacterium Tous-C8FEB]